MADEQASRDFDVALSYAGEDRGYVAAVASGLREAGVRVFYDEFMVADLWGVDLYSYLDDVYRKRARFTVVFISQNYAAKAWTSHECQSVQARAMNEAGPYLLPVRIDDAELPGLRPTFSYIDARHTVPDQLVELIRKKLGLESNKGSTRNDEAELVRSFGVPGTSEQRQRLLSERPYAWERILWASINVGRQGATRGKVARSRATLTQAILFDSKCRQHQKISIRGAGLPPGFHTAPGFAFCCRFPRVGTGEVR